MSENRLQSIHVSSMKQNHVRFEHVHDVAAKKSFMFAGDQKIVETLMFSDGQIVAKCALTSLLDRYHSGFSSLVQTDDDVAFFPTSNQTF